MTGAATTVWLDRATHGRLVAAKERLGVATLGQAIRTLLDAPAEAPEAIYRRRKRQVDAACRKHAIQAVVAFGSRARGEAATDSDLDLAIVLAPDKGLAELQRAQRALEQAFACSVDVIDWPTHRPRLMAEIRRDGIVLFGKV